MSRSNVADDLDLILALKATDDITSQIASLPMGTKIEIQIKSGDKLRASEGDASNSYTTSSQVRRKSTDHC
jgi:hypothetical protein